MSFSLRPYRPSDQAAFCDLVARYFREDLNLPLNDLQAQELACDIAGEIELGVPLTLAFQGSRAVGFINYQVDFPESSWCFHPGWGCIRECYVLPEQRGSGAGRALLQQALCFFRQRGAAKAYLTADTAIPFWVHLGFARTGQLNEKNELEELVLEL